jgi:uncharacterized protein (TIGR03067 family)
MCSGSVTVGQDAVHPIQGTWQAVSLQDGGRTAPADIVKSVRWIVTDSQITQNAGDERADLSYTLDLTKSPVWIDFRRDSRVMLGIVKVDGDTLTVCFSEGRNAERSTAFESRPDSPNDVLLVFHRIDR